MKMRYCKKCLQPDTRPGILFNEAGVCYACLYEEMKKKINWDQRFAELQKIADEAKRKARESGIPYDCVIGVSGGKDSTFQAVYYKEKLGLRPLLVNCAPDEITEIGRKNLDNLNKLGFDMISIRVNPNVAKSLARKSFFEKGNIVTASEYCLWASAYIMADRFDIPLIIQGENAALTLGAALEQEQSDDAFSVVDLNTLKSFRLEELAIEGEVGEEDLFFYAMPNIERMKEKGIRAVFLQYYAKEGSQVYNADFAVARGLAGRIEDLHELGRYRRYSCLDSDLVVANQMIKYLKFGFGFATDEACYDIREDLLVYRDYLSMCAQLCRDLSDGSVLYPRDLHEAHDQAQGGVKAQSNAQLRQASVAAVEAAGRLEFQAGGMAVVLPATPDEIIAEGRALHHCVGSHVDRVTKRECVILFVRRREDLGKPFYTVEIRGREVVQVRGRGN